MKVLPCIAADIGGTNARFALVRQNAAGQVLVEHRQRYRCGEHESPAAVIGRYLEDLPGPRPDLLSLAVAGPVENDEVQLTNRDWHLSAAALSEELGMPNVCLVNDIAAQAYGLHLVDDTRLREVKPGVSMARAPCIVVGLGTGLGVTGVVQTADGVTIVPGEAGHARAAAAEPDEWGLIEFVSSENPYLCWERFLSGPGLVRLTNAVADRRGHSTRFDSPEEIERLADEGSCEVCVEAVSRFCAMLGGFCGDMALVFGARGGVYLTGSMMSAMAPFVARTEFAERFNNKGPMRSFAERVPVWVLEDDEVPLIGAAIAGAEQLAARREARASMGEN